MIDLALMKQIYQSHFLSSITREYGEAGTIVLREIMEELHTIYRYFPPENIVNSLIIFKLFDQHNLQLGQPHDIVTKREMLSQSLASVEALQLLNNGKIALWQSLPAAIEKLADYGIVYEYNDCQEWFYAKKDKNFIPKLDTEYASMFAIPTFSNLREALLSYNAKMARYSSCKILSEIWYDKNRIFVKNAQEKVMRNSLTQFLKCSLRGDVEVRPEQNVDESHPVDIKVTWRPNNNLALLEIKWLGKSIKENGDPGTEYSAKRARDGATQLAEYLDWNITQAPLCISRGYLIVFDFRRKASSVGMTSVDRAAGLHYLNREIDYSPHYHKCRTDFDPPLRFFIEPICT
jgi:hypothetical protein